LLGIDSRRDCESVASAIASDLRDSRGYGGVLVTGLSAPTAPDTEQWWVDEVIRNRARTNRNKECTPSYYNFEGEGDRRKQDGNYNGTFLQYFEHMSRVKQDKERHFRFR
jgi:hypothetical protein